MILKYMTWKKTNGSLQDLKFLKIFMHLALCKLIFKKFGFLEAQILSHQNIFMKLILKIKKPLKLDL